MGEQGDRKSASLLFQHAGKKSSKNPEYRTWVHILLLQQRADTQCLVQNWFLLHKSTQHLGASTASPELQRRLLSLSLVTDLQCPILLCSDALIASSALSHLGCEVPVTVTKTLFVDQFAFLTGNNCLFMLRVLGCTKAQCCVVSSLFSPTKQFLCEHSSNKWSKPPWYKNWPQLFSSRF